MIDVSVMIAIALREVDPAQRLHDFSAFGLRLRSKIEALPNRLRGNHFRISGCGCTLVCVLDILLTLASINMRRALVTICFLLVATRVSAWDIRSVKDPISNALVTGASVTATGASLIVACTNGQPQPRLSLDQGIEPKNTIVSYRFDDGPVKQGLASVSPDGHNLWPWPEDYSAAAWKLKRVKRFSLNIGQTHFDFDLSKGDGLPLIVC